MIKKDTIKYRIVSLIGLAGEMPTEELYKLKYGKEYIRKTISSLITKGYIKVYKFENKKYLRLTVKCKRLLSEYYPERFACLFTGATRTNKIRSDIYRRARYHRLGELLVLLDRADVKIFADEKSLGKRTHGFARADTTDFADYSVDKNTAEFYTSCELKEAGFFMNARTSRAMGVIYSYPDVYIVYNFGDEVLKMEYKTEHTFFITAGNTFNAVLRHDYGRYAKIIFVGNSMDLVNDILKEKSGGVSKMLNMSNDDNVYFLDNSQIQSYQLEYFINKEKQEYVRDFIYSHFGVTNKMRYYGRTPDRKTTVIDCTICNLSAIRSIKSDVDNGQNVKIVCFNFQMPYLKKYFGNGDNVEYYQYNL